MWSRAQGRLLVAQGGMDPAQGLHAGILFAPGETGVRKSKAKQTKKKKSTHLFLHKGDANPISINCLSRTPSLSLLHFLLWPQAAGNKAARAVQVRARRGCHRATSMQQVGQRCLEQGSSAGTAQRSQQWTIVANRFLCFVLVLWRGKELPCCLLRFWKYV